VTQTISTPAFDRGAIEAIASNLSEPGWVRKARIAAFDRYESLRAPDEREPGWRRTTLSGIDLTPPAPVRTICSFDMSAADLAKDVVIDPLEKAVSREVLPDMLLREHRGLSIGKYSALAESAWQGGGSVWIGDGVQLSDPIFVNWSDGPYPRLLVRVGKNARASVVERHVGASRFTSGLVDVVLEEGAHLTYVHVQNVARESVVFSHQRAHVGRDAKLVTLNFAAGGRLARADVEVELCGRGAESDMLGLIFGEGDQQFGFHTLQGHRAPDTRSDLLFKSALDDNSRSAYTGVISIGKDAPRSEAYQANRNLLLSPGARADTEPKLEILIDDVARCTHGATIGPVDDEQLFYLRSRGIDPDTAARMIVDGFFQEVFQKVGDERATAGLAEIVAPHIGRLGAQ
jgi:Fe-S cluster assembly protein SufD